MIDSTASKYSIFNRIWIVNKNKLIKFINENNRLPDIKYVGEYNLAYWCKMQLNAYFKGKLPTKCIKLLSKIKGWCWSSNDNIFHNNYIKLINFTTKYNKLPKESDDVDENNLYNWCKLQRKLYEDHDIKLIHIMLLNKIPKWKWQVKNNNSNKKSNNHFDENYIKLVSFQKEYNRLPYKSKYEDINALYEWCESQKQIYENEDLTLEYQYLLSKVPGWSWSRPVENSNNTQYDFDAEIESSFKEYNDNNQSLDKYLEIDKINTEICVTNEISLNHYIENSSDADIEVTQPLKTTDFDFHHVVQPVNLIDDDILEIIEYKNIIDLTDK